MTATKTLAGSPATTQASQPYDWRGLYISGELGYGLTSMNWQYENANYFNTLGATIVGNDFTLKANGVVGGIDFGYNFQIKKYLLGLQASVLGTDFSKSQPSAFFPTLDQDKSSMHVIASITGRIGYVIKQFLAHINFGYAGGNSTVTLTDHVNSIRATTTQWASGWIIGAGADYRVSRNFALGFDYNFLQIYVNNQATTCPACGTGVGFGTPTLSNHINTSLFLVRLTYLIH